MNEVLIYGAENGRTHVDVRLDAETVWLSRRQMAELLDTSMDNMGITGGTVSVVPTSIGAVSPEAQTNLKDTHHG